MKKSLLIGALVLIVGIGVFTYAALEEARTSEEMCSSLEECDLGGGGGGGGGNTGGGNSGGGGGGNTGGGNSGGGTSTTPTTPNKNNGIIDKIIAIWTQKKNVGDFEDVKAEESILTEDKYNQLLSMLNDLKTNIYEVPAGAVMAFNTDVCPEGREPFTDAYGRFIMGVGEYQNHGKNEGSCLNINGSLNTDIVNNGYCGIKLKTSNLPSHFHRMFTNEFTTDNNIDHKPGANHKYNSITVENEHKTGEDNYSYTMAASATNMEPTLGRTSSVGEGETFDVMPPYVQLLYCVKIQ